MPNEKIILNTGAVLSISAADAEKLIAAKNPDSALLYLYLLRNSGTLSASALSDLGYSADRLESALSALAAAGLISRSGDSEKMPKAENMPARPAPADELPQYSAEYIKNELANGSEFKALVEEVQRALGKVLSSSDLMRLFGFYDALKLPPAVILMLVNYCKSENERKYGAGKNPSMRYIEQAAYTWEREGIFTLERAEEYLHRLATRREKINQLKRTLNISGRDITKQESDYITEWLKMGFDAPAFEIAYERTVMQTGALKWPYMDSIMKNWHKKGLHSKAEILENDTRPAAKPRTQKPKTANHGSGESPAPTAADLVRMQKVLESMND